MIIYKNTKFYRIGTNLMCFRLLVAFVLLCLLQVSYSHFLMIFDISIIMRLLLESFKVWLLFFLHVNQANLVASLNCFYCNSFVPKKRLLCPANQTEDLTGWKETKNKFVKFNYNWCQIIVHPDGSIIEQVTCFVGSLNRRK